MREFLKGMHGFGQLSSPSVVAAFDLSRFHHFVDLGGASGHLAAAARERYPNLQTTVFDLPAVKKAYPDVVAGDFFTDPLPPADLYALGRILHDWSDSKMQHSASQNLRSAAARRELCWSPKSSSTNHNVPAHMQSLNMLVCTEGRERTAEEFASLLRDAGFHTVESRRTGTLLDATLAVK